MTTKLAPSNSVCKTLLETSDKLRNAGLTLTLRQICPLTLSQFVKALNNTPGTYILTFKTKIVMVKDGTVYNLGKTMPKDNDIFINCFLVS